MLTYFAQNNYAIHVREVGAGSARSSSRLSYRVCVRRLALVTLILYARYKYATVEGVSAPNYIEETCQSRSIQLPTTVNSQNIVVQLHDVYASQSPSKFACFTTPISHGKRREWIKLRSRAYLDTVDQKVNQPASSTQMLTTMIDCYLKYIRHPGGPEVPQTIQNTPVIGRNIHH
jgi:hypothetical protein